MIPKQFDSINSDQDAVKTMNLEQFDCIVRAIVEGKYSWACVLILRFAGYNPAHYIPYRTYKRLIKENRRSQTAEQTIKPAAKTISSESQEYSYSQIKQYSELTKARER